MKQLSIIIVSWNVKDMLLNCLKSIFESGEHIDFEVFVVDNASIDGTDEMVKSEFPQVKLIQNTENLGCAKALNIAIKRSQGKYILWLNPDMRLFADTLKNLIFVAENNLNSGVIGAKLVDENDEIVFHVRKFPKLFDQFLIVSKIAKLFPSLLDAYLQKDFDYEKEQSVDSIRGSFFCVPRKIIDEIGMFDERFFLWFEEVDYCKRVKSAGYDVLYSPKIKAIDYVGQSFLQVPVVKKQKMFIQSMVKYFIKHGIKRA